MVQKEFTRPRGRPRAYDRDEALRCALMQFWRTGYSGTSLDMLSDAMDMNRPSMYAAFGDKRSLYLQTLDRYVAEANVVTTQMLDPDQPLAVGLKRFYEAALESYWPPGEAPRGCYLIGTALTESMTDLEIKEKLDGALRGFEKMLAVRIKQAKAQGEVDAAADPAALASIAAAVLHTLAVRSRSGESRAVLNTIVTTVVRVLCNGAPVPAAKRVSKASKPRR